MPIEHCLLSTPTESAHCVEPCWSMDPLAKDKWRLLIVEQSVG